MDLRSDSTRQGRLVFWLALAGLVCLFPFFFVGGPDWSAGPLFRVAWNLGHPLFFAFLTLTVQPWRFVSGWKLWLLGTAAMFLVGAGVELAQSFDNRDVDWRDMFRNLTGFWAVLALRPWVGFRQSYPMRDWLLRAFAVAMLAIDLVSVSHIAVQQVRVSQWLPDLYDFQQDHPERFWRGNVTRRSGEGCGPISESALAIDLTTRRYSGASLDNLPSDWRGNDTLEIVLWNPQNYTIPLTLRINDTAHERGSNIYHDRFNRTFQIAPGTNHIRQDLSHVATAPKDRTMNMDDVRRLMFFTTNLSQPARLCLSKLRLESTGDAPPAFD